MRILRDLNGGQEDIRWVPPRRLHSTLQFFEGVNRSELTKCFEEIRAERTNVEIGPKIRILGRGNVVVPVQGLTNLAKQVRSATRHLAAESELPFVGHITIGRIKGNKKADLEGTEIKASFQVRKLLLVESVLHPEGPEYSIMQTKHLF